VLAYAVAGCGDKGGKSAPQRDARGVEAVEEPQSLEHRDSEGRGASAEDDAGAASRLVPPQCPPGLPDCERASGTILYVERVDPDGDGDAHFVLAGGDVTGPGVSTIAVPAALRPQPLPGPGEKIAAAGRVYEGSYGQKQIEAVAVRTGD
jgi:hypothetical protein